MDGATSQRVATRQYGAVRLPGMAVLLAFLVLAAPVLAGTLPLAVIADRTDDDAVGDTPGI
ncbi:hypothetical protein ACPA9J_01995 [Pseudomonas aeruginosa]